MKSFTFERIQYGYWGRTRLGKQLVVEADSEYEALKIIGKRKDAIVRLKNGDSKEWILVLSGE